MGKELIDFYNKARKIGGEKAVTRLIIITGIIPQKAEELKDDRIFVEKFENAIKEIEKDYK